MAGPLEGVRVLEMAGLGATPFGVMLLADLGADVVRVDRPARPMNSDYERRRAAADPHRSVLDRGRRSLVVDLRRPEGVELVLDLVGRADVLVEGFRPGVMERLGLGPDVCLGRNPKLVYGRLTGWGQTGPLAPRAGHDITYIALTGALRSVARKDEAPIPPLSMAGDMAGGGMLLALGVVSALLSARATGQGQVVDAAMVDGASTLLSMYYGLMAQGRWRDEPGTNFGDTGAPYYDVYATADGQYVAFGALEEAFYQEFLQRAGIDPASLPSRDDESRWPELRAELARHFASRTRDEWDALLGDSDACVAPVLSMTEAPSHPHLAARGTHVTRGDVVQPAPAPRFSGTPTTLPPPAPARGEHGQAALADWGVSDDLVTRVEKAGGLQL
ncbi:Alpha-methylacyl-CoA racemase [Frankia canadensis]|uniref:Alpha-methylacyl-CoA racemase n=1 Tax=Frankia canadensis TaxID=1836972 RepID=A0A2I2KNP4_9ACTN|nr:CaiB/BaiF CoA-transferase family protein [Frankia canadensis]SNQ47295.1 Alpha-methylacyl-CoA racemase [Frankia canadensis]SOU54585.1 Alpha-methylacyl-CoA racemase [Frankia canadensis]